MASINNLNEVANNALHKAVLIDSLKDGIQEFSVSGIKVFTSDVRDINLNFMDGNHAILTGEKDLDLQGNDKINLLVGNDGNNDIDAGNGNDLVSTGAGNDRIWLGNGDDLIEIDGWGSKSVNGGEGNDLFIIKGHDTLFKDHDDSDDHEGDKDRKAREDHDDHEDRNDSEDREDHDDDHEDRNDSEDHDDHEGNDDSDENTHVTISDFSAGDKLRVYADANEDGQINLDDVENIVEENGNTTFMLKDGTSFTLEGVTGAAEGNITYDIGFDADGNPIVDLS